MFSFVCIYIPYDVYIYIPYDVTALIDVLSLCLSVFLCVCICTAMSQLNKKVTLVHIEGANWGTLSESAVYISLPSHNSLTRMHACVIILTLPLVAHCTQPDAHPQ